MSQLRASIPSDETTPLLPHDPSGQVSESKEGHRWSTIPFRISGLSDTVLVPIIGCLIIFLAEAEYYVKNAAIIRAIEAMACLEYYSGINDPLSRQGKRIPETFCKKPPIADRLGTIAGIVSIVRMACAFTGTFAMLSWFKAEKRRTILILHRCNVWVSDLIMVLAYYGYPRTPIWLVCLSGATSLVGGNYDLCASTIFASYADLIPDKARRSNLIFMTSSFQYVAQIICLPATGYLMNLDGKGTTPEVSLILATAIATLSLSILVVLFPETFHPEQRQQPKDSARSEDATAVLATAPGSDVESGDPQKSSTTTNPFVVLRNDFGLLRVMFLLMAMLFSVTATRQVEWFGMYQYPSIKFHWSLSKTTYLLCLQGVLGILVFTFLLPTVNRTCQKKYGVSAESTSVGIAAASALILMVCCIVFGLPSLTVSAFVTVAVVYPLGGGIASGVQTYIVSAASTARSSGAALSVISLAATAGKFVASAIWPATLHLGLSDPSGKLRGLPFLVNAVLLLCVVISMTLAEWAVSKRPTMVS